MRIFPALKKSGFTLACPGVFRYNRIDTYTAFQLPLFRRYRQ
ncbi:hypothetical protein BRYFOR_06722 [Marvinbryantia formatexigens DSM 14469]|uniref:Uncharacterized protein n=1 Tax=Marvinbryantia formatexigens DSM 14469 TaxID=478749 RepID=C6LDM4_9FIRM|nr:hypothetical protein BRYFOR_06722 [Marvinbryantia formatexigens DSM 14469]